MTTNDPGPGFATIETALSALRAGLPVLVLDDADRENEGDVVLAAATLTDEWMAWAIRHSSGYICAPMTNERADALDLPLMVAENEDPRRTAYTVTCDARTGVTTGISAADRAHTVRLLAGSGTTAVDLVRPGHVVPLRARDGGVLVRGGHTEATVDLCRLAGLPPVGAIGELVDDDGTMMRTPQVLALGVRDGLPVVTIADLRAWRARHDRVDRVATTRLPTEHGVFDMIGYRDRLTGAEHIALVSPRGLRPAPGGAVGAADEGSDRPVLVRMHSECLTGDAFGSRRCDCGPQLQAALATVATFGGVVVYLRGQEGRGVGLLAKLSAYELQDAGFDTVDAQTHLGLPIDAREYGAAAGIVTELGIGAVELLTNNPAKSIGLTDNGIRVVSARPLRIPPRPENERYLRTKAERMGHDLGLGADTPLSGAGAVAPPAVADATRRHIA